MDIKPIKTDADYRAALKEIETLMMVEPDSPEGEKLDVMVTLIEAYEARHYPPAPFFSYLLQLHGRAVMYRRRMSVECEESDLSLRPVTGIGVNSGKLLHKLEKSRGEEGYLSERFRLTWI